MKIKTQPKKVGAKPMLKVKINKVTTPRKSKGSRYA